MTRRRRPRPLFVLAAWATFGAISAPAVSAQIPGQSVFESHRSLREEFLAKTLADVKAATTDWTAALNAKSKARIAAFVEEGALAASLEGWLVQGRAAVVDSLVAFAGRSSAYGLTILDFDAGGSMAYVFGQVYYQTTGAEGRRPVVADVTMVMVQRGQYWKVRAYIERPRLDGPPA